MKWIEEWLRAALRDRSLNANQKIVAAELALLKEPPLDTTDIARVRGSSMLEPGDFEAAKRSLITHGYLQGTDGLLDLRIPESEVVNDGKSKRLKRG